MPAPAPHFHLLAEAERHKRCGSWRFVLQTADGQPQLEARDAEPEASGERLELLAIVRGLEALDGPSRVTLITSSSSVSKGLQYGLDEWRANDWQWERHGEMVPVKNSDLWRRIDHALQFHDVDCRVWRIDRSHQSDSARRKPALALRTTLAAGDEPKLSLPANSEADSQPSNWPALRANFADESDASDADGDDHDRTSNHRHRRRWLRMGRRLRESLGAARLRIAQLGTGILPRPWLE